MAKKAEPEPRYYFHQGQFRCHHGIGTDYRCLNIITHYAGKDPNPGEPVWCQQHAEEARSK
jgi:hypothetical protein